METTTAGAPPDRSRSGLKAVEMIKLPPTWHGVNGIDKEIDKDLLQLLGVDPEHGQGAFQGDFNMYPFLSKLFFEKMKYIL